MQKSLRLKVKIPTVINLVKRTDYDAKISDIIIINLQVKYLMQR